MKKIEIERRMKNAFSAFFDHEPENSGENGLSFARDSALFRQEAAESFDEKGDRVVKILKRAFLFLPGVLYLFFGTLMVFTFDFLQNPLTILIAFLIGSFMTIFGIGNLKNPKHLAIPLSIVAVGTAAFWLFSTLGNVRYVFEYGIYFFPLALISAVLAKNLVDKTGRA